MHCKASKQCSWGTVNLCMTRFPSSFNSRKALCYFTSCRLGETRLVLHIPHTIRSFKSVLIMHYRYADLDLHDACAGTNGDLCPTQESKLAVLWTVGIFALNFGPVFVGPILDWVGPKLTTTLGKLPRLPLFTLSVRHSSIVYPQSG